MPRLPFRDMANFWSGVGSVKPGLFRGTHPCRYVPTDAIFDDGVNAPVNIAYLTIDSYEPIGAWTSTSFGMNAGLSDLVEIPPGSGRKYWVLFTEVVRWKALTPYWRATLVRLPLPPSVYYLSVLRHDSFLYGLPVNAYLYHDSFLGSSAMLFSSLFHDSYLIVAGGFLTLNDGGAGPQEATSSGNGMSGLNQPFTLTIRFRTTSTSAFFPNVAYMNSVGEHILRVDPAGLLQAVAGGGIGDAIVLGTTVVTDGIWRFAAMQYDGTSLRIRLDTAWDSVAVVGNSTEIAAPMTIASVGGVSFMQLKDFRLYASAISTSDLDLISAGDWLTPVGTPIRWYPCDEGAGTLLHEISGSGDDMTFGAGALAPVWLP